MKFISPLIIIAAAPLLTAAIWMDEQPSFKHYEAPVLAPPAVAVPVSGKEIVSREVDLKNPVPATEESLAQGKMLFDINCAMCHGQTSAERGPVGKKLTPPPPGLDHDLMQSRSDFHVFNAITSGFGRMPAFQDKLSPPERWNIVNYLRARK
jgi:mono/diheme cytochrome c family protein